MNRLEQRWQRRWTESIRPPQTVRFQDAVELPQPPEQVWELVSPVEHADALWPELVARAFIEPGSPPGLGARQCFIDLDGNTSIEEVTEFVEARRMVTVLLSPPMPMPTRSTLDLQPRGEGCVLTIGMEFDFPWDTAYPTEAHDQWRQYVGPFFERVRRSLASDGA